MLKSMQIMSVLFKIAFIVAVASARKTKSKSKSIEEPEFSRGESKAEKIIKAYQYGQDLLDDEDTMLTVDELMENVDTKGSKKSYLCKDYKICVSTPADDDSDSDDKAEYWEKLARATITRMLEMEHENDKSIMNAEMYANLVTGGDRSIKAHVRAIKTVVGDFIGMDTYNEAVERASGSSYFKKMKKSRESRKSKSKLDCDGADEGSLKCDRKTKTYSKVYDHVKTMSWRGTQALEAAEDVVDDI